MDEKLIYFILMALCAAFILVIPILFFAGYAEFKGIKSKIVIFSIAACSSGIISYISFWLWFISTYAGFVFTILVWFFIFFTIKKEGIENYIIFSKKYFPVVGIWFSYSIFLLSFGLAPSGLNADVLVNVATRFSHQLPIDNQLPLIFANQIAQGGVHIPMIGDWLSSDRPPLQTGYFLFSGLVELHSNLIYQIFSTELQTLWIIPLFIILNELKVDRFASFTTLIVLMFNGITLVHSLFTWPKLLPVFYLILLFGILYCDNETTKNNIISSLLIGCLSALALLTHGGSVFALLGLGSGLLLFGPKLRYKLFVLSLICFLLILAPWLYYQHSIDPPGNRLIKWHLAGIIPIDNRSFRRAFLDSYSTLSIMQFLKLKLTNLISVSGNISDWVPALVKSTFGGSIKDRVIIRESQFFATLSVLGWLAVPTFLFFFKNYRHLSSSSILGKKLILVALTTTIFWVVLMFGPSACIIHQGSLLTPLFLIGGSTLILCACSRIVALVFVLLQLMSIYFIYLSPKMTVITFQINSLYILSFLSFSSLLLLILYSVFLMKYLQKEY